MYLSCLRVKGFKTFDNEFTVRLNKGINVIVGENGSGKTAILDAIRLLLCEDEFNRTGITENCFHRALNLSAKSKGADQILLKAEFKGLKEIEQIAYLPWLDANDVQKARLNVCIDNKEDYQGKFRKKYWGNESEMGLFEWELLNRIHCVYLPPLRDAEDKLKAYRGSRLARLLKNLRKDEEQVHSLEIKFSRFNRDLLRDESIQKANQSIRENVQKSVGKVFGQETSIQFTEINFNRIVERLRLLFYPIVGNEVDLHFFRELNENSLGLNNILYISTILAELEGLDEENGFHKVLLIEEPEAHLHPQLQIRLFQYLQAKSKEDDIQIIVTTHSPTLAAAIDLDNIKVVTRMIENATRFTCVADCGYELSTKDFLQRWLDVTKSNLLFAKGIIFVEGIAEALVVSELAKAVLRKLNDEAGEYEYFESLDDYGISIINLNGIYFKHFFRLFQGYRKMMDGSMKPTDFIPVRCSGLTDNDPDVNAKPTKHNKAAGKNPQLYLIQELEKSVNCKLFTNLKTFEYDLAMEGNNLSIMADVQLSLISTNGPINKRLNSIKSTDWDLQTDDSKAEEAFWLLQQIDKGVYAQKLAQRLQKKSGDFAVPDYIVNAIKWVVPDGE
jgi:predicted ATP-dependent endonuclease of OLD family